MKQQSYLCPVCDTGSLISTTTSESFQYKGVEFVVADFKSSECGSCGEEVLTAEQSKFNDCLIRDEHRKIEGLLSGKEIKSLRKRLGLTQEAAATLFGGGANAFSKYERGEVIQSMAMNRLLRIVDDYPDNYSRLQAIAGLDGGIQYGATPLNVIPLFPPRNGVQTSDARVGEPFEWKTTAEK